MIAVVKIKDEDFADQIHEILHEAFMPFRDFYTAGAFNATVVSSEVLKMRMDSPDFTVYGGFIDGHLAGTVSTKVTEEGNLYFMSMAVSIQYSGKGLGKALLNAIEEEANTKNCSRILLETYGPLTQAIRLYEHYGFNRTGFRRDYSGIEVFEMVKILG